MGVPVSDRVIFGCALDGVRSRLQRRWRGQHSGVRFPDRKESLALSDGLRHPLDRGDYLHARWQAVSARAGRQHDDGVRADAVTTKTRNTKIGRTRRYEEHEDTKNTKNTKNTKIRNTKSGERDESHVDTCCSPGRSDRLRRAPRAAGRRARRDVAGHPRGIEGSRPLAELWRRLQRPSA